MITSITGELTRVLDDQVRVRVGGLEHQVLVPELVRRKLQTHVGEEVTLHTLEYIEGNPTRGRLTPRLVGFLSEPEIEFFELFCTVDGVGVRTALKAIGRPIRDIAGMIQRQDTSMLATLPGISSSAAERCVAKLRKKVARFALMTDRVGTADEEAEVDAASLLLEDAVLGMVQMGHPEAEARAKVAEVMQRGKKFKSAEEIFMAIYERQV